MKPLRAPGIVYEYHDEILSTDDFIRSKAEEVSAFYFAIIGCNEKNFQHKKVCQLTKRATHEL